MVAAGGRALRESGDQKMDPISLILTALAAGLTQGAGQGAAAAVRDACAGLRNALSRRLSGRRSAQDALAQYVADPQAWRGNLEVHLRQAGADRDQAILDAAAVVMRIADPGGARAGKYTINLSGSQGVQVGNHNHQSNVFNVSPSPPAS
jgi:RIP homotypic interaction motif